MLQDLGSIFGGHTYNGGTAYQNVNFAPDIGAGSKFMMQGDVTGGDVHTRGDGQSTGMKFGLSLEGGLDDMMGGKKGKKKLMLMNLGSIFGGHGESKHNVNQ